MNAGREGIDAAVAAVAAGARPWAVTAPAERARLCDRMIGDTLEAADGWVADAIAAKRLTGNPAGEAEEWSAVWLIIRNLRALRDALGDIAASGRPRLRDQLTRLPARRFPQNAWGVKFQRRRIGAGT